MRECARDTRLSRMMRSLSGWRPMWKGSGSMGTRMRLPLGSVTNSDAGSITCAAAGSGFVILLPDRTGAPRRPFRFRGLRAQRFHFPRAQRLAVGAIAAHFGARQQYLKTEMAFDLLPQALQGLAEKLFHLAAAQANHVRMFLFEACFVVVLIAPVMHQVELTHQTAGLEHLEGAIDGDAIDFRVALLSQLEEALGVEMLAGLIDELEQDLALARKADAAFLQRSFHGFERHKEWEFSFYQSAARRLGCFTVLRGYR